MLAADKAELKSKFDLSGFLDDLTSFKVNTGL